MDGMTAVSNRRTAASPTPGTAPAVNRLTLTDFRCYAGLELIAEGATMVLTGSNGSGKTNLLEALSYLVPGRGLRGARLSDVGRRETNDDDIPPRHWAVAARLASFDDGPEIRLGTGLDIGDDGRERRVVRIDGEAVSSQAALADHLAMVWLTPQMDGLFQAGGTERRRFLDRLVFAGDAAHVGRVTAYDNAARDRLRLLSQDQAPDPHWLAALESTMAEKGIAVAAARLALVDALAALAGDGHGPFPGAGLAINGEVERWLGEGPALQAEDRLKTAFAASRAEDASTRRTTRGPQRSDLVVSHRPKARPASDCSTGEQKALLIGIVLAHARLRARERGAAPVLLLDEVAAHLDSSRREALYDHILDIGAQAWLTGTDAALFAPLAGRARFAYVDNGRVAAKD